jgi:hypothetical protein
MARAWRALATGDFVGTIRHAEGAAQKADFFRAITWPLAGRAAIWAGDLNEARRFRNLLDSTPLRGMALDHDRLAIRAGVAALEDRPAEAAALFLDGVRGFRDQGLAFDLGLVALDAATVLNSADRGPEIAAAIDQAAATFSRLGAKPFADRLDAAVAAERARAAATPARAASEAVPS